MKDLKIEIVRDDSCNEKELYKVVVNEKMMFEASEENELRKLTIGEVLDVLKRRNE